MSTEGRAPSRDVLLALNRATTTGRLVSGVVHEVNNALQVIGGSVELLEQQPELPAPMVRSLDRIKRQSERAASALAELTRFTKAPLDSIERVRLREVVTQAVSLRKYAAGRQGLAFEVRVEPDVADLVTGNSGLLQLAVLNLLVNAEQAMSGTPGAIVVTVLGEEARAGVAVTDAGQGVPEEIRSAAFGPFVSTRADSGGAGLGLWAVQTIAEQFSGSVELRPHEGGTTAVFWVPRA